MDLSTIKKNIENGVRVNNECWLVYRYLYQLVCDRSFDATIKTSDGIKVFNFNVNDLRIFSVRCQLAS